MTTNERAGGKFRIESDALGDVQVPANRLWGAQTQRSHLNFPIGVNRYRWGRPVIRALGILKKCAALANGELGELPRDKVLLLAQHHREMCKSHPD
jgi:fumarate hydratase class II